MLMAGIPGMTGFRVPIICRSAALGKNRPTRPHRPRLMRLASAFCASFRLTCELAEAAIEMIVDEAGEHVAPCRPGTNWKRAPRQASSLSPSRARS
jgi:hypothetical protein